MPSIAENISRIQDELKNSGCRLIPVTKTKSVEEILEAYETGLRAFGENKVQELEVKQKALPRDIEWHMIGHLQTNKIKYIAPFVHLIQSVDSFKLLQAIDKGAEKAGRVLPCLLQISIAQEETKYGFSEEELFQMLKSKAYKNLQHIRIDGVMGIATNSDDEQAVRAEFARLKKLFDQLKAEHFSEQPTFTEISMGMTHDYQLALAEAAAPWCASGAEFLEKEAMQPSPDKLFLLIASGMGALAVAIGAFGAHALKDLLAANQRIETFETASRYHFYHAFALLAVVILFPHGPARWMNASGHFFIWGTLIFSGSLYVLCLTNMRWLGAITPIGGVLLIAGWVTLAICFFRQL